MQNISKNILIVYLFIFTVFNTGIPVFLHYCRTMDETDTEKCHMCLEAHSHDGIGIRPISDCCSDKVAASPADEFYVITHPEKDIFISDFVFILPVIEVLPSVKEDHTILYSDTSPPVSKGNDIFILNSTFLI